MKISRAMNRAVVVDDNIKLSDAARIMSSKNIGSLIVMRKDRITGIITERDVMRNVSKLNSKISQVMSRNVITVNKDENLNNAALLMSRYKIKRLPVLKGGKLIGIITATDVLANSDDLGENFFFE